MPVLTFRVSVPLSTPANNPLLLNLVSGASSISSVMIWTPSSNATIDKCGYRLVNRQGAMLIPDLGSKDNFAFGNGEDGWAPIPSTPKQLDMAGQVIEGPPYFLNLKFYNNDTAAILVAGYIVVSEPMARLAQEAMIYEFLTSRKPTDTDVSPETKTPLEEKKSKVDTSKVNIDVLKFLQPKKTFEVKSK